MEFSMKDASINNTTYIAYCPQNAKEYQKFIKLLLKSTEQICFTINPWLDNINEFCSSKWGFLSESIIKYSCDKAIDDPKYDKSLLYFKNDYPLYNFFIHLSSIFDFTEDEELGIIMENPIFIKNREIICYTLTHEKFCNVKTELYVQLH